AAWVNQGRKGIDNLAAHYLNSCNLSYSTARSCATIGLDIYEYCSILKHLSSIILLGSMLISNRKRLIMNVMAFNHYAKLKQILAEQPEGWYIRRIDEPTSAKNFRGELVTYGHHYRLYSYDSTAIKYGKFQKIDKLASILGLSVEELRLLH